MTQDERAHEEEEAHGATPPHGDPLTPRHPQTTAPHVHGDEEEEDESATPPHGDPLEPPPA